MSRRSLTPLAGLATIAALVLLLPAPALAQTTQVVEYYHTDALGSVRAVTNQSGVVIRRHDFLPFGEELQATVPPPDKPLFTGKERDAETGLDYFGARYQRAGVGRFTSIDPAMTFDENLADPQRWNRYAYVRNNPLRYTDPTGMVPADIYDKTGSFIGSDGNDDGVIYVVTDDKTAKQLRGKRKQGQTISPIEIPFGAGFYLQPAERTAMVDAVSRSNSPGSDDPYGGFHEEGFVSGSGGLNSVAPGPYTHLPGVATISLATKMEWVHLAAHVHPRGTSGNLGFGQEPTRPQDYNSAYGPGSVNAVIGARNEMIYFYDRSRVVATMPLKRMR